MRTRVVLIAIAMAIALGLGVWVARDQRGLDLELPPLDRSRPRPQGDFWVGAASEPPHLNLLTTSDGVARSLILRYTHDTLLERDWASGAIVPAVAEAIDTEPGGAALRVRLRGDVVFDDGTPLTVDDLEFAFRAAKAPGATFGSAREGFDFLAAFERQDARSFRLLVSQQVYGLESLVGLTYPVVQARYWRQAVAELAARDGKPAPPENTVEFSSLLARIRLPGPGTGAYSLARVRGSNQVAWRRGVDLFLVQNPLSWRRRAAPESWNLLGIGLRFLTDPGSQLAELRAGRLDWYSGDDAETIHRTDPAVQQRMRLLDYRSPRVGHHMVVWNLRRRPFDDVRVRQALSRLFDRHAIVGRLLGGRGQPAAAWYRPTDEEYPTDLEPMPFDPAAARSLLQEAGVVADGQPPFRVTILVANQLALQRRILELALPAFTAAGLQLVIEPREWGDVVEHYESRDFDAVLMNWSHGPLAGPPFFNFHSSQVDPPGKNYSGLADREVDALLERTSRSAADRVQYIADCRQLAHVLRRLEPVSLLVHPRSTLLIDRRYQDAEPNALGVVMDRFWVAR